VIRLACVALLMMGGCQEEDPCNEVSGTCLTLEVTGHVGRLDSLEVTLSGAVSFHNQGFPEGASALPVLIGIGLPAVTGTTRVDGIAYLDEVEIAAGKAVVAVTAGHHSRRTLTLTALGSP